jgi:hypothetical protein
MQSPYMQVPMGMGGYIMPGGAGGAGGVIDPRTGFMMTQPPPDPMRQSQQAELLTQLKLRLMDARVKLLKLASTANKFGIAHHPIIMAALALRILNMFEIKTTPYFGFTHFPGIPTSIPHMWLESNIDEAARACGVALPASQETLITDVVILPAGSIADECPGKVLLLLGDETRIEPGDVLTSRDILPKFPVIQEVNEIGDEVVSSLTEAVMRQAKENLEMYLAHLPHDRNYEVMQVWTEVAEGGPVQGKMPTLPGSSGGGGSAGAGGTAFGGTIVSGTGTGGRFVLKKPKRRKV